MAKPCPIDPKHPTKEVTLSAGNKFDFCECCKEDVDYLARQQNPQNFQEDEDEDFDNQRFHDEDEDDDGGVQHNPWANPPGFNPNPVRNMGTGSQQFVLLNDNTTGQMVVEDILRRVFGKDSTEATYVMKDAHYKGRSVCFYADPADVPRIQQEIETIKQEWKNRGCPPQHVDSLTFVVENNPNNQNPAPQNP